MGIKNVKKLINLLLMIVLAIAIMGACAKKQSDDEQEFSNTLFRNSADLYPITMTDSFNREVTIEGEVKKIVSLAPNITEIIYALNKGDRLVGRSNFCDYPAEVSKVKSVGDMDRPDIESIAALSPDLVICSGITKKEIAEKIEELGIKVFVTQNEQSFEGVYKEIQTIGRLLAAEEQANSVIEGMRTKLDAIKKIVSGVKKKPTVYYVVSYGEGGDFTPGEGTYINDAIELAGGINVAKDAVNWAYSLEKLMEKNPNIVIISKYFNMKEGFMSANGYKYLDAVKNDKVFEIDNNMLDRVGPRMVDGIEEICRILHPKLWD